MGMGELELRLAASERYFQSTRQAEIQEHWARLRGKSSSLLKYEEVAGRLHLRQQIPIGHHMVSLHHIVGSVGRYREFARGFLPRPAVLQDRWVAVDVMLNSLAGLPPVELYKVGQAYFVVDGNHRISVARANGNKDIEASVIEWQTTVPFTLEDFAGDKWLLKAAYADFLAETKLDRLGLYAERGVTSDTAFSVTNAKHYATILQHIAVHRYLYNQPQQGAQHALENGAGEGRVLSWTEAVESWHDTVYMPVVAAMRAHGLLARFPKHTEVDLYIAITHERERVAATYELAPLSAKTAVAVFAANHSGRLLEQQALALRQHLTRTLRWARAKMPAGMTPGEFAMLRLRHDEGELSLSEARRKQPQASVFAECLWEPSFSAQFSG